MTAVTGDDDVERTPSSIVAPPDDASTVLQDLGRAIDEHLDSGDYASAASLIGRHVVETWLGRRAAPLRGILARIDEAGHSRNDALDALRLAIAGTGSSPMDAAIDAGRSPLLSRIVALLRQLDELRLTGRTHEAGPLLDAVDHLADVAPDADQTHATLALVANLHCGTTAMLASDMRRALRYLTRATLTRPTPALAVLIRDAHTKIAIIHAALGDPDIARRALREAAALPRTTSWLEDGLDANTAIVEALLEADGDRGIAIIDTIVLGDVGQMWPFYIRAVYFAHSQAGRWRELLDRITLLEQMPFPRIEGKGFTGSIFPVTRAIIELARGDVAAARVFANRGDPENFLTQSSLALVESASGRPQQALGHTRLLTRPVRALQMADLWRYAEIAQAYLQLGRREEAVEALRAAFGLAHRIDPLHMNLFSPEAHALAREHIAGWPRPASIRSWPRAADGEPMVRLTRREREILLLLAEELSRTEIAERLFISVNTLKSHQRSLYRKLGVTTREAAVLRAEREGWL